jgi:hypothetical protein
MIRRAEAEWKCCISYGNRQPALCVVFMQDGIRPSMNGGDGIVIKFLLWCFLFILCWPLALLALVLYPVVWLLLLPFRIAGIAVHGTLEFVAALISLPVRLIRAI